MINPRYKKFTLEERLNWVNKYWNGQLKPPDYYIDVPCGNCIACQKKRLNDYRIRLNYEISRYPNSVFITLTFAPKYLRKFYKDPNSAVRLFLDRARKRFGRSLRHWIVAEYGTLKGRVHYHGILFNVPRSFDADTLRSLWKYGFIYIGYANAKTANYIVKYCTKNANNGKKPPRIISSKGIGKSYLNPLQMSMHRSTLSPFISVGDANLPLPRYYYDKIFDESQKVQIFKDNYFSPFESYLNGKKYTSPFDFMMARKRYYADTTQMGLSAFDRMRFSSTKISPHYYCEDPFSLDSPFIESFDDIVPF